MDGSFTQSLATHVFISMTRTQSQGEICVAGSRVYVQEGISDEFVRKIAESCKSWIVGDPFSPHVHQGPQVIFPVLFHTMLLSFPHGFLLL